MIISKQTQTWEQKPTRKEVETCIKDFFKLLNAGKLDEARDSIALKFNDWNSQIWSLWQDTYLVHLSIEKPKECPKSTSFKSNGWKNNLDWLQELSIDKFHWQRWALKNTFFVSLCYANKKRDVTADFSVQETPRGLVVMREIFRVS